MKQIKISHEVPIDLFSESITFNDYEYILVHLLDTQPQYREFYKHMKRADRPSLLDCSVFELGVSYDIDAYIEKIIELQPSEYIIPDVLESQPETCKQAEQFFQKAEKANLKKYCNGKSIGVIQGKNYDDIKQCHVVMDKVYKVDKLAISFDYSYYEQIVEKLSTTPINKHHKWMYGRAMTLCKLIEDDVINYNKPYHLLGCALPQEGLFYNYSKFRFIDSIDTSSPIVHGHLGIKYGPYGLVEKNPTKLADIIHEKVYNMHHIKYNIEQFRKMWSRTY